MKKRIVKDSKKKYLNHVLFGILVILVVFMINGFVNPTYKSFIRGQNAELLNVAPGYATTTPKPTTTTSQTPTPTKTVTVTPSPSPSPSPTPTPTTTPDCSKLNGGKGCDKKCEKCVFDTSVPPQPKCEALSDGSACSDLGGYPKFCKNGKCPDCDSLNNGKGCDKQCQECHFNSNSPPIPYCDNLPNAKPPNNGFFCYKEGVQGECVDGACVIGPKPSPSPTTTTTVKPSPTPTTTVKPCVPSPTQCQKCDNSQTPSVNVNLPEGSECSTNPLRPGTNDGFCKAGVCIPKTCKDLGLPEGSCGSGQGLNCCNTGESCCGGTDRYAVCCSNSNPLQVCTYNIWIGYYCNVDTSTCSGATPQKCPPSGVSKYQWATCCPAKVGPDGKLGTNDDVICVSHGDGTSDSNPIVYNCGNPTPTTTPTVCPDGQPPCGTNKAGILCCKKDLESCVDNSGYPNCNTISCEKGKHICSGSGSKSNEKTCCNDGVACGTQSNGYPKCMGMTGPAN